jgi:hypothetical protein
MAEDGKLRGSLMPATLSARECAPRYINRNADARAMWSHGPVSGETTAGVRRSGPAHADYGSLVPVQAFSLAATTWPAARPNCAAALAASGQGREWRSSQRSAAWRWHFSLDERYVPEQALQESGERGIV